MLRKIMEKIFDIHNHSIWGVDDGARDFETSMAMFEMAYKSGITDIILTPHNKPDRRNVYYQEMLNIIEKIKKELKDRHIEINLYPGNEIYYRMDIAERIQVGKAFTMATSNYILLEYYPTDEWAYIKRGIDDMMSNGYIPIIAHVERYQNVISNLERVQEIIDKGAYIQVNASSVMGEIGWQYKRVCKQLLNKGMVSFIATDAHDTKKRVPKLDACIKYVSKKYGQEYAKQIFSINPQKIVDHEMI